VDRIHAASIEEDSSPAVILMSSFVAKVVSFDRIEGAEGSFSPDCSSCCRGVFPTNADDVVRFSVVSLDGTEEE
jgi:hypothetical protein